MLPPPPTSTLFPYTTLFRSGPEISIGNACDPVHAKLKATSHGTSVLAVWPSCEGLKGKVKLKGNLDTTCADRKSTRLNSSHSSISYAVFCLKKKKTKNNNEY